MIYLPAIYDEHLYQRINYLLLTDPVLYAWMHWVQQDARDTIMSPLEIRRKAWDLEHHEPLDFIRWRVIATDKHTFTYPII